MSDERLKAVRDVIARNPNAPAAAIALAMVKSGKFPDFDISSLRALIEKEQQGLANRPETPATPMQLTDQQRALHRAQYRFVPLNETIVHHALTDLDLPLPGNLCATIKVRWFFDTPMLVGEKQVVGDVVGPIEIGRRWAIPGSTLRGMIRSIVEAVTFGRLGRFERDAKFTFKVPPRFTKAIHKYSVGDVAARSHSNHVKASIEGGTLRNDFAEALFGHVVEPDDAAWPSDVAEDKRRTFAHRGRVDFGLAWAEKATFLKSTSARTIMGAPRPSFSPFYLVSEGASQRSWSDQKAKLAGRKRYLPRYPDPPVDRTEALNEELAKPIKQFKDISTGGRDPGPDVTTELVFLNPAEPGVSAFDSEIRLHNVSPVEAGAVVWALTWGGDDRKRHMIGRAKGFGAGQVKAEVLEIRGETNAGAELEPDAATKWVEAFKTHMGEFTDGALPWDRSQAVQGLLASADPEVGNLLAKEGKLHTLDLKDFAKVRKHEGSTRLLELPAFGPAKRRT